MRKLFRVQADLFVTSVRAAELIGIERQKAVSLLQALLTEAVKTPARDQSTSDREEAGNE